MAVTNLPLRAPTRLHQTSWRRLTMAALALAMCVTVERPTPLAAAGVITVTTTAQGVDPGDGVCSLAEAIDAANFDASVVPSDFSPDTTTTSSCSSPAPSTPCLASRTIRTP